IALEGVLTAGMDQDSTGLDVRVDVGAILVIEGGDREERTSVVLALLGRLPVTAGRCKVAGLVLPTRASSARARTAVVLLDRNEHPVRSLLDAALDGPTILGIDGADTVADDSIRTEIRELLTEARTGAEARDGDPMTLLVACSSSDSVRDLLPAGVDVHVVTLGRTTPTAEPARSG
ncbi:MAG: hypothetical protein WBV89_00380, partial [Ilumatobacter sp.]